ncbi:LysR family transcriptional regulator [Ornithinibacillus gellani]|uniref:LysR family transcriptional regulator n=1 Tax=Ornithinibacillus gellani TaxID=2293253 RepID=UPI000F480568|nr:LysR family transcriptional regulator [Ornithinibacillus gellani]TQS74194.1 LysR family transcriptional regulator [Ornithinibacillus gellani]
MVSKLDLYRVFFHVGDKKSFSAAARELYMTQPAVSQSISQLERELETRLFDRSPKGVKLTYEGAQLYDYVQSAMNLLEAGEQKIQELRNLDAGELRLGVGDTISRYFLMPFLEMFHEQFPGIKLKIVNGTTLEICDQLKSRGVDVAICNLPLDDDALELRPCYRIQDVFVAGKDYAHLLDHPLTLAEIAQLPLILLEPNSNSRKYVEDYLLSKGVRIAPEFELGSHDLLLAFAEINLGVACVTREFSQGYVEAGKLIELPLAEPIPERSIGICSLKHVPLSPASMKFVEIIEGIVDDNR